MFANEEHIPARRPAVRGLSLDPETSWAEVEEMLEDVRWRMEANTYIWLQLHQPPCTGEG